MTSKKLPALSFLSRLDPAARTRGLNVLRVLISVGLLAWIITTIDLDQLLGLVRGLDPAVYGLAISIALAGIVVRAYRWLILLRAVGARVSFGRAIYLYYVGAFFNTFLPTGFGGDVVRVLEIGEGATSQQAAGTVLVDRLTGFIALFGLAALALPFAGDQLSGEVKLLIAGLAGAVLAGSALLFEGRLLRRLTARFPRSLSLSSDAWLGATYGVITACGPRAIAGALWWSVVFNLLQVAANYLFARALGLDLSAWLFVLFIPVATVALLVPISIAGLGVREGIYILLFGQAGLAEAQAVALSLGAYSLDFAAGLLGGVIYLTASALGLRRGRTAPGAPGPKPSAQDRGQ